MHLYILIKICQTYVARVKNRRLYIDILFDSRDMSRRNPSFAQDEYAVDRPVHLSNLLLFYVSDAYQIRSRRLDPLYEFDVLLS